VFFVTVSGVTTFTLASAVAVSVACAQAACALMAMATPAPVKRCLIGDFIIHPSRKLSREQTI
jgi:hypothetical protein